MTVDEIEALNERVKALVASPGFPILWKIMMRLARRRVRKPPATTPS